MRAMSLLSVPLLSLTALPGAALANVEDPPVEREQIIRPGMPAVPERVIGTPLGGSCTIAFLVTDGARIYATTQGHCYEITGGPSKKEGFEHWGDSILTDRDDVFSARDCGATTPRICSSGKRWGRFVYAINNTFADPVDNSGVIGTHNPNLKDSEGNASVGDFGLIRLHPNALYNPAMCHFGGPTDLYTNSETEAVVIHSYHSGMVYGYNQPAGGPILPGWTTTAVVGPTPSPWYSSYTFTGVPITDPGASGGPIMASDGRALGMLGGLHYLDRLDTNLARAGKRLNKQFTLLTAGLKPNTTPFGIDEKCVPAPSTN